MFSKRHFLFNIIILVVPWLSVLFIGKRDVKRYFLSSFTIVIIEILHHIIGHKRKWWKFYGRKRNFFRDELPFTMGPYLPISLWSLKLSYGNFKKFVMLNVVGDAAFAYIIMDILKRMKIIRLHRLNRFQFFLNIHYKAYLLYGLQYLIEILKGYRKVFY